MKLCRNVLDMMLKRLVPRVTMGWHYFLTVSILKFSYCLKLKTISFQNQQNNATRIRDCHGRYQLLQFIRWHCKKHTVETNGVTFVYKIRLWRIFSVNLIEFSCLQGLKNILNVIKSQTLLKLLSRCWELLLVDNYQFIYIGLF